MDDEKDPVWLRALGYIFGTVSFGFIVCVGLMILAASSWGRGHDVGAEHALRPYCEAKQQFPMKIKRDWRCVSILDPAKGG
jgi:hypothetical protein